METLEIILKILGSVAAVFAGACAYIFITAKILTYLQWALRDDTTEKH